MERNVIFDTVVEEIAKVGGQIDDIRPAKGGHRLVYWTTGRGVKTVATVQGYNGNWRAVKAARSNVRRAAQL